MYMNTHMKICIRCSKKKLPEEFYAHPQSRDGRSGACKECVKRDANINRKDKEEYYKEYDRNRAKLPKRVELRERIYKKWKTDPELKKRTAKMRKSWQEKNKIKRAAHIITGNALRSGILKKQPCQKCGNKAEAHHEDYNYPLDVIWLCKRHHAERHVEIRQEKRNK